MLVDKFIKFISSLPNYYAIEKTYLKGKEKRDTILIIDHEKGIDAMEIPRDKLEKFLRKLVDNEFGKWGYHNVNEFYRE